MTFRFMSQINIKRTIERGLIPFYQPKVRRMYQVYSKRYEYFTARMIFRRHNGIRRQLGTISFKYLAT